MNSARTLRINTLITNAVNDGINLALERYEALKTNNYDSLYLPKYDDFPSISSFSSGLPHFSTTPGYFGTKIDYKKILSDTKKDIELESWKILVDFFLNDNEIYEYIMWKDWNPPNEKVKKEIYTFSIFNELRSLIDAIIHSTKNPKLKSQIKTKKISNWVRSLTNDAVNYDLIIPIIYYQPDCLKFTLDKNIRIQKIDDNLQLSRYFKLPDNVVAHKNVVGAATHAIYITNILNKIPNRNRGKKYENLKKCIDENFDLITKIFSICRLVINDSIGFCQIIAKPIDFEENWLAELPGIQIFGYKKYPSSYEEGGWHEKKTISKTQLLLIKKYFNEITDDKKIKLANRKLFDADLRNNKDDSVLDLATGLEALLSDSTDNLKYKISLRSAAICKKKKFYQFTPIEVKKGIKTFYDFRSAIIHGNTKNLIKVKTIQLERFEPIDTLWFASNILKHIIEFLILNPKFREMENIDNYLLNEN